MDRAKTEEVLEHVRTAEGELQQIEDELNAALAPTTPLFALGAASERKRSSIICPMVNLQNDGLLNYAANKVILEDRTITRTGLVRPKDVSGLRQGHCDGVIVFAVEQSNHRSSDVLLAPLTVGAIDRLIGTRSPSASVMVVLLSPARVDTPFFNAATTPVMWHGNVPVRTVHMPYTAVWDPSARLVEYNISMIKEVQTQIAENFKD